jgi:hypothetical protein
MFIPDPDLDFLPIPDPGGQKNTGSRIQIRNSNTGGVAVYTMELGRDISALEIGALRICT